MRCNRCHVPVAYRLEDTEISAAVVYILSEGLITSEEMKQGDTANAPKCSADAVAA